MLTLPIKKKWFDMILSGEKKEEYREIKPYYISRIRNNVEFISSLDDDSVIEVIRIGGIKINVRFRNGYGKDSPSFVAKCALSVGAGKEEWGADPGKKYFVLTIKEILRA